MPETDSPQTGPSPQTGSSPQTGAAQFDSERMQCMEVWGGNRAVARSFQAAGLRIWMYSRPFGQALGGGDVYYLSSCASGRITRMLLADVCGHGEIASHLAMELRDLMRRNVNYIKQTRFVREMNQQFTRFGEQGGFATALVSTYFAPTRRLALCSAGHPMPVVFRQSTSQWSQLQDTSAAAAGVADTPLGVVDDAAYHEFNLPLQIGDMVLSYSDGVMESSGADGNQLGQAGVLRLLRERQLTDPGLVIPTLIQQIRSLAEDNLTQDDVTLFLCQATGGGPSLKDNLLAPFRLLGPVTHRTELH